MTAIDDKPKILVVEDELVAYATISETLFMAGFMVERAENGKVALEVLKNFRPAAVVLDRRMPVMDGNETLKAMKENPALKDIPVLVLTGDDDVQCVMESLALGANDYIVKPFVPPDLLMRLRVVMAGGGVKRKEKKDFEGFEGNSNGR
jgi:DNA-binding response OmpR family regulator